MRKQGTDIRLGGWLFACLLSLPVLIFLLAHFFNHSAGVRPTGFIQYDNLSYAGNASQLLDEHFHLTYANRLNASGAFPRIYFQPQHLLLALIMRCGVPPGPALCLFVYACSIAFFRIVILLYDRLFPASNHRKLMLILLSWGGGLLALSGWMLFVAGLSPAKDLVSAGLALDPASGWWGLNLGRSLFFSMEAFYHLLFFAGIYFIINNNWRALIATALALSCAHPFTGLEFLCIAITWMATDAVFFKNPQIPRWAILSIMVVLALHLWYYLVYLNRFPEHRIVFIQYQLNWKLRFYNIIPAYILVAIPAAVTLWKMRTRNTAQTRLLICWSIVAFVLSNHEWFVRPMQPLHFTRGYLWSPLFLLGAPFYRDFISRCIKSTGGKILLAVSVVIFLSDNINWIYINSRYMSDTVDQSVGYLNSEQQNVLECLQKNTDKNTLVIGLDKSIPYLATVYTSAYAWISHVYNTPFYAQKSGEYGAYLQNGTMPAAWKNRDLVFVVNKANIAELNRYKIVKGSVNTLYESRDYIVYRCTGR